MKSDWMTTQVMVTAHHHGTSCGARYRPSQNSRSTMTATNRREPQVCIWWMNRPSGRSRTVARVLSKAASGVGR